MKELANGVVCELAEAFALGALGAEDRSAFEAHLPSCESCRRGVAQHEVVLGRLAASTAATPDSALRQQILDLADAPESGLDLSALAWDEPVPGVRMRMMKEDAARGMRAYLVWAQPGARHPRHRHGGAENILVLRGALRDDRGDYGPGEVCRSRPGSTHSEEALPGEDCVCYVVYYGPLEYEAG
jgi:anti-sigma factor ChrR (cupin superfamily)